MMILLSGNLGYVGSVLASVLAEEGYEIVGFDTEYYGESCRLFSLKGGVSRQIRKDIRDAAPEDLKGIRAVIHLAALSNDPLGELNPGLTEAINLGGTLRLARLAKEAGVERFLYASSQSMYGIADVSREVEEDNSEKNPVTAYARTKWEAECALKKMGGEGFQVVCFRPSTVFGASPKLRCDIVYNNLVASAYTTGKIEIKSDGTPWRPVVHVRDVCSAFLAGLRAPVEIVGGESFNIGIPNGNFTVRQLAEAAGEAVPGATVVFTGEHGSDARTYRVSFQKILTRLKGYYRPAWDLKRGGRELVDLFRKINFKEEDFRGSRCNRLANLKRLQVGHNLDQNLRWL